MWDEIVVSKEEKNNQEGRFTVCMGCEGHRGGKKNSPKEGEKEREKAKERDERDASGEAENPVAVFRDRSKVFRSEVSTRVEEEGRWRTSTKPCARSCEWGGKGKECSKKFIERST